MSQSSAPEDVFDIGFRGLRVYPYPRVFTFLSRGFGSGTVRVHFSRVGYGYGRGGYGCTRFLPVQTSHFELTMSPIHTVKRALPTTYHKAIYRLYFQI